MKESGGAPTPRSALLERLANQSQWDLAVVGGGATGLGVAVDAASRGLSVVLIEAEDFAKGTSSRATKLLHGGVRYLAQGNLRLVREALHERATVLRNAPRLAQPLAFVIPVYTAWDRLFYGIGLTAYALLAGRRSLGQTRWLNRTQTLEALPNIRRKGLVGGVRYWDAQFDDARLAIALARTAAQQGALVINYCSASRLHHTAGRVSGIECVDRETGKQYEIRARCVVNATGVWADEIRQTDLPSASRAFVPRVAPSRGAHLVVDASFLRSDQALMVPKTSDGRVLFAVPWQGRLLVGTTDVPTKAPVSEPIPTDEEVDFILEELSQYVERAPTRADVLSAWAGLRPLVRPGQSDVESQAISREHDIFVSDTGLVTVTGGKWTTYRVIASDTLDVCASRGLLQLQAQSRTDTLLLVGADGPAPHGGLRCYGSEAVQVAKLPGSDRTIGPSLTEAMVRFAARYEFARYVEDVLARRSRMLFTDARRAAACADDVASILRDELGIDPKADEFRRLALQYARVAPDTAIQPNTAEC